MGLEVGNVVEGVVNRITPFGAFVELEGGKNGLVHISEVADVYVRDVRDFLSEGDKVTAKIIKIDERGKIALSLKQMKKPDQSAAPSRGKNNNRGERADRNEHNEYANRSDRVDRNDRYDRYDRGDKRPPRQQLSASFEDKLSKFMKESDEKLADWKRKTDSKRGGRGSRRSD